MHIDGPMFPHRKVIMKNQYSPKKRWDQNTFGSERQLLMEHVQSQLREHQNDADILEKFRKQAEQLKIKKRKQKFPHLYQNKSQVFNPLKIKTTASQVLINRQLTEPRVKLPQMNELNHMQQSLFLKQLPKIPQITQMPANFMPQPNYMYQLQSRLQYERLIAQKDLQLFKRQEQINKQRKQIKRLHSKMKFKQKQDQLEKYMKSQEEMKKINKMLAEVKEQLESRRQLLGNRNFQNKGKPAHRQSLLLKGNQSDLLSYNESNISNKKVKSFKNLNAFNRSEILEANKQDPEKNIQQNNPSIYYSPNLLNKKSSVFEKIPLYNNNLTGDNVSTLDDHLEELKSYNKRLQYLNQNNRRKLSKMA